MENDIRSIHPLGIPTQGYSYKHQSHGRMMLVISDQTSYPLNIFCINGGQSLGFRF
jgi:hypothetical protein